MIHPRLAFYPACMLLTSGFLSIAIAAAADNAPADPGRFTPQAGFTVQEVVKPGSTGSLVAMAFSEAGDIIASRERGPLLLIQDKDHDGQFETVETYCDKVSNCQGILPLGEHVFAVGEGPAARRSIALPTPTPTVRPTKSKHSSSSRAAWANTARTHRSLAPTA